MCLVLSKSLYGNVRAAILWHTLLTDTLVDLGFELNTCDLCAATVTIEEKQFIIVCHVDDIKVSHIEKVVVRQAYDAMESKFGPMKVVIGK